MVWYEESNLEDLVGKTLIEVDTCSDEELILNFVEKGQARFYHEQDCCESVELQNPEKLKNELENLLFYKIVDSVKTEYSKAGDWRSSTETVFTLIFENGKKVEVYWIGESNGYYSEGVSFFMS